MMTRRALKQFINDQINERLKTALNSDQVVITEKLTESASATNGTTNGAEHPKNGTTTTEEELEGFYIIRAILREIVPVKRVVMRDVQSYCGILLDDNNRKPICRLWFNATQKYIGFFDAAADNTKEERVPIAHLDDVYKHAERLKATVARYESKPMVHILIEWHAIGRNMHICAFRAIIHSANTMQYPAPYRCTMYNGML